MGKLNRCRWFLVLLPFTMLMVSGCSEKGPEKYPVSGTVTLDKVDLPEGNIRFIPTGDEGSPAGAKIKAGQFELELAAGSYRVEIEASREVPGVKIPSAIEGEDVPKTEQYISSKYNTEKSTLKADIKASADQEPLKFELSSY